MSTIPPKSVAKPEKKTWIQKKQLQIEATFAVYMFTPYEKFAFYSIVFLLLSLTFIAAILYLPHHVSLLAGRVWYYINGDNIDVAASAREAVRGAMSSSGVSEVTKKVAETTTVVKNEL